MHQASTFVPAALPPWYPKCRKFCIKKKEGTVPKQRGFSLIELLIVVAVILVIAAIAIPNLIRSKIAANESSAIRSVREISTAELSYHVTFPSVGFAPDLVSLGGAVSGCVPSAATACILDSQVSSGTKSGYQLFAAGFASGGNPVNTEFVASAAPQAFNKTGVRNFCIVTDGVVRINPGLGGVPIAKDVPTCTGYPIAE
jgi:type IV pilus assembly protein PilA